MSQLYAYRALPIDVWRGWMRVDEAVGAAFRDTSHAIEFASRTAYCLAATEAKWLGDARGIEGETTGLIVYDRYLTIYEGRLIVATKQELQGETYLLSAHEKLRHSPPILQGDADVIEGPHPVAVGDREIDESFVASLLLPAFFDADLSNHEPVHI